MALAGEAAATFFPLPPMMGEELSVSDPPRPDLLLVLTPGELSDSEPPDLFPRSGLTPDNTDFKPTAAFSLPAGAGVLLRGVLFLTTGLLLRLVSLGGGAPRLREADSLPLLVEVVLPLLLLILAAAVLLVLAAEVVLALGLTALADFVAAVFLGDFLLVDS